MSEEEKRDKRNLESKNSLPRKIQMQDIPPELQPLVVKITKLEAVIMTTRDTIMMNFDHLIDKLIESKKESMNLIQQAKILAEAKKEEKK